jgi:hypothetical protein
MCSTSNARSAARRARYHFHRLNERYGIDAKLFDWSDQIAKVRRLCLVLIERFQALVQSHQWSF